MSDARRILKTLYDAAVRRALPAVVLPPFLPEPPRGRTVVVGAGKAAGAMAQAVEKHWPAGAPLSGLVVTRYGHVPPRDPSAPKRIEVVEAAHPVPDAAGERSARQILEWVSRLTPDDLVLCLVSGGGSALLALPAPVLSLAEKQRVNQALLLSGASIGEMNCVRKHLSGIKGGRLGAACAPARVLTLLISDVPGDDPAVIASGPTVADPTTCADALDIARRYSIELPPRARAALESGKLETPKPGDRRFAGQELSLVAAPRLSLQVAAEGARELGIAAHVLSDDMEGEAREIGRAHAAIARSIARCGDPFAKPCVLLSGGETTVTVKPRDGGANGRGGRASEFALGAALDLKGEPGVHLLAADTDGIDGSEDNAGAYVAPDTLARSRERGLDPRGHLDRNDAYGLFAELGDLLVTGPTYTNVNDFRAILIAG